MTMEQELEENHPEYEHEEDKKSPLYIILGIVLILLVVMMSVPYYAVKLDPEPRDIPSLQDVLALGITLDEENTTGTLKNKKDIKAFVKPNDPEIKRVADFIASQSCSSHKVCQAKALFYFVRDEFDYVADPRRYEFVKDPKTALLSQGGDCDDASVLLATFMESIGIKSRFVFVPGHVFVEIYLPEALKKYKNQQGWITVDGTCRYCSFGELSYIYTDKPKSYVMI